MQAVHFIVHTEEQAREILTKAHAIALDLEAEGAKYEQAFTKAVDLLGQRSTVVAQPAPVGLDLSKIRTGNAA